MPSISEQGTVKQRENEFLTEVTMSEEQIPVEDMLAVKTVALKPSGIRKFFDIVSEMKDAISLGVGEPDFDTPWHIRDEGIYSLEKGRTFYTSNSGLKELREAIAQKLERDQGLSYDPMKEILITVGGSEAIDLMFRTSHARSWRMQSRSSSG